MNPFLNLFRDFVAVRVAVSLMLGMRIAWVWHKDAWNYWYIPALVSLILLVPMAVAGWKRLNKHGQTFAVLSYFFFFFLGAATILHSYGMTVRTWPAAACIWQATVVEKPHEQGRAAKLTLWLTGKRTSRGWSGEHGQAVLTTLAATLDSQKIEAGDRIWLYAKMEAPHNPGNPEETDFADWMHRQGTTGTATEWRSVKKAVGTSAKESLKGLPLQQRLQIKALNIRQSLTERLNVLPTSEQDKAVVAALTLGDKSGLTHATRQLYAATGSSHVLALSGLHLGILISLILLLLGHNHDKRGPRLSCGLFCILFIWGFAWLTGMSTSLLRSAIMYTIFMFFWMTQSKGFPLNHLAVAALVLLILHPMSMMDVGFQLSFLSVFAILFLQPFYNKLSIRNRVGQTLCGMVYVSLAAQIATAPLVAYYFHLFPVYFLLSNAVVIPAAYLLLGGTFLFFLLQPFGAVAALLSPFLAFVVKAMNGALGGIASLPHSTMELYPSLTEVLLIYCLIILLVSAFVQSSRRMLSFAVATMVALTGCIVYEHHPWEVQSRMIAFNAPSEPELLLTDNRGNTELLGDSMDLCVENYINRNHLGQPKRMKAGPEWMISFKGKRILVVTDNGWRGKTARKRLDVDVLYLGKGCTLRLKELLRLFHPRETLLSGRISEKRRSILILQAQAIGWRIHDLSQGAWEMAPK